MDYLVNLNLNKNELQNARVQNLAAAPSNPVEGQIYHNTVDHVFYYYNGTKWVPVIDDGGVTNITGGTDISVSASTGAVTINHNDIETTTAASTAGIKKITTDGHGHIKTTANAEAHDLSYDTAVGDVDNVGDMLDALIIAKADIASTLDGYGITDAKIQNGTITLGSNTITPLTSQWTANLITGSAATDKANKAGGTNSIYLNLVENSTVRNAHQIVGSGTVTVASDANGKITITGSAHPTAGTTATAVSTTASGGSATTWSKSDHVHSIALATGDANGQVKIAGTNVSVKGLAAAAYKPVVTSVDTSDSLPTSGAVKTYVDNAVDALPEPMVFKGSVGTSGTVTWANLPAAAAANEGHTYKVITAHTAETGKPAAAVGDTIISTGSEWVVIPSGDEPEGTVTSVAISNGGLISVSGSPITSSGTITLTHGTPSGAAAVTTAGFYKIKTDAYGHVNGKTAVAKSDITGLLGNYVTGIKLGASATASTGEVTVPIVSQTTAGLMSAADKTTLDNLSAASTGAITHTTLTIAQGQTSVSASGVASKLVTFQAYQGGEAVIVDYDGTNFSVASAAASAITIKCVVTV